MKFTLITGASSGIGEAFARKLAAEQHNLVLVARSEDKLSALCDELTLAHKITAHYVAIDLNDYQADKRLFKETENQGLEVDWLINNAGFGSMGDFANLELENELEMISLNVMALVSLTHRYLEQMRERKNGIIINVSSTVSFQPIPFMATYGATKAFVSSFSEAIAEENRKHGIRVLSLCPGTTDTNFFEASDIKDPVKIKGMQTSDQVVEAALRAIERGKSSVVSGWINYFVTTAGAHMPNSVVTKTIGGMLRPKVEKQEQEGVNSIED